MVAVLFRTLDVLRIYDLPAILTNGGGGHARSLSMLVIKQIRQGGFNSASALSTIVFLLIALHRLPVHQVRRRGRGPATPEGQEGGSRTAAAGNPVAANATSTGA